MLNTVSEYVVKADTILTGKGFEAGKALRVKDGYIVDIGDISISADSTDVFDLTGYTVIPCFCDYHLHLYTKDPVKQEEAVRVLNHYGITTVFDGGSQDLSALDVKNTISNTLSVKSAGNAIYKKDGYGSYIGHGVETVRDAEMHIDTLLENGADYIKIVNSGIYLPEIENISKGGFHINELKAIVEYAQSKGVDVACHANGEQAVEDAVQSEVTFLIHGLQASDSSLACMSEMGTAFIPTIHAFASLKNRSTSQESRYNIDRAVDEHMKTVQKAFNKGVRVLPGSDAGPDFISYGSSFHGELRMLQKAGIPYENMLASAVIGKLETGAPADFLVLAGLELMKVFIRGKCIVDNFCPE